MREKSKFITLILSFVFCLSAAAFGQQTGGSIDGTVRDQQQAAVPNATVTIQGVNVGFNRTVQSDSEGLFRVQQVPPGTYKITVGAISGFAAKTLDNITVVVEKTTTADVVLGTDINAVVDVTSDPNGVVVDSTDSKIQTNITTGLIDSLPKGVSFTSLLKVSPATRPEPISGQFQIDGASGSENSFIVDGQEVSNFRTGTLNAVNNIPTQLVQEVQIKSSGFEAEHGGASGGVIVVSTKGGTDAFRGEFGSQFEIRKFQPGNTFVPQTFSDAQIPYAIRQPKDGGTNFFPAATFGGPIIKKRVWFLGSYTPQVFNTTRDVRYYGSNPTVLTINPAFPQTDRYQAKTTYNYGLGRVDASPTNNLRVFATYLWNPSVFEGQIPLNAIAIGGTPATPITINGSSIGGVGLAALQGGRTNANTFTSQVSYTPSTKAVVSLRYGRGFLNEKGLGTYAVPNETRLQCSGSATNAAYTTGSAGCAFGFQNNTNNAVNLKDVSIRNTFNADLTYVLDNFVGTHSFKGGYEYGTVKNDVSSGYANTGVITLQYGRNYSVYGVSGSCALPTCIGIGRLQRFGTVGVASNRYQGLYIQDKWQPIKRLSLNLGVRAEKENLPAFDTTNGKGGIPISFNFGKKIAPRLGVAYDLFGDGKTRIFASYGLFFDRLKFELPRGSFGGDFFRRDYFPILATNPQASYYTVARILGNFKDPIGGGNPSTQGGLSILQGDFRIPSNLPAATFTALGLPLGGVDPNLKPFTQSEYTVGVERELSRLFVMSARFTRKNVEEAIEDQANLGTFESESYIIGNVGKGLAFDSRKAAGYVKQTQVQRLYRAFEVVLTKRLSDNYFFSANYTFSRLEGNYSGLASSDEITNGVGRASPGVNRFFDYANNGYNALGQPDNGRLATDRPHVFKAYGGYNFDWFKSKTNSTDISFFTTVQSGTPQTTFIGVAQTSVPLSVRGDLGRTPRFSATDLSLSHKYKFGRDDRFTAAFDVNFLNVFNQHAVTYLNTNKYLTVTGLAGEDLDPCYDFNGVRPATCPAGQAVNTLLTTAINNVLNGKAGPAIASILDADPNNRNRLYKAPAGYQAPRNVRFGFRLFF